MCTYTDRIGNVSAGAAKTFNMASNSSTMKSKLVSIELHLFLSALPRMPSNSNLMSSGDVVCCGEFWGYNWE